MRGENVSGTPKKICDGELYAKVGSPPPNCVENFLEMLIYCNYLPCRSGIAFIREGLLLEHDFSANPWRDEGIA